MKRWAITLGVTLLVFAAMTVFSRGVGAAMMRFMATESRELTNLEIVVAWLANAWARMAMPLSIILVALFACWGVVAFKRAAAERLQRGA